MLTGWVIFVMIGSLLFIGLPSTKILYGSREVDETFWIKTPFVGLAIIVLILQNLVYLDMRLELTTPVVWLIALLAWIWLILKKKTVGLFSSFPYRPYGLAAIVFSIHSLGLFLVGAAYYVGRAWVDQWNYVALAQFLTDYPYSLSFNEINHVPYLVKAISLKDDRIGQSIFHGFLASSTLTNAKTMFEPAILLTSGFTVLATYLLCQKLFLSKKQALFTALFAGILPSITLVHLESFFSQALAIPLLIIWPVLIKDALDEWYLANLGFAALLLAAATSIYTEFFIIFLGVAFVIVVTQVAYQRKNVIRLALIAGRIVILALLLNIGFLPGIIMILGRISIQGVLLHIYPWAYQLEGIEHLWFGEFFAELPEFGQSLLIGLSVLLLIATYAGLVINAVKRRDALSLAILSIVILPIIVRLRGDPYAYQFYKILLSVSPLFPVGLTLLANLKLPQWNLSWLPSSWPVTKMSGLAFILMMALSAWGTVDMVLRSVDPNARRRIGAHNHELLSPTMQALQDKLSETKNLNMFIAISSPFSNGWLAYFARHNRLWLAYQTIGDVNFANYPVVVEIFSLKNLPENLYILSRNPIPTNFTPPAIWQVNGYGLWKVEETHQPWLLVTQFNNPNGIENWGGKTGFWLGTEPTTLDLVANQPGVLVLKGEFILGPSLPEKPHRAFLILTDRGYTRKAHFGPGNNRLEIPFEKGLTKISLQALDVPSVTALSNGDKRSLLLGIARAEIDFRLN